MIIEYQQTDDNIFGFDPEIWYDDNHVDINYILSKDPYDMTTDELVRILPRMLTKVFTPLNHMYLYERYPELIAEWRHRNNKPDDAFPNVTWSVRGVCDKYRDKDPDDVLMFLDNLDEHLNHCRKCKKNIANVLFTAKFHE